MESDFDQEDFVKEIDGVKVPSKRFEICDAAVAIVEVGTNGYQGGDSGHGCRTFFRLELDGGDLQPSIVEDRYGNVEAVEIVLGGDAELLVFTELLAKSAKLLENLIKEQQENYRHNRTLNEAIAAIRAIPGHDVSLVKEIENMKMVIK